MVVVDEIVLVIAHGGVVLCFALVWFGLVWVYDVWVIVC